jgi:hypothetical protein
MLVFGYFVPTFVVVGGAVSAMIILAAVLTNAGGRYNE